jgi:hypothetical protein
MTSKSIIDAALAIKRTATACTLIGAALTCLLGPMPAAADGLPSLAHGADSNSFVRKLAEETVIDSGTLGVPLLKYWCPSSHPWLLNVPLSPNRIVPNGVEVLEPGGIGVSIFGYNRDHDGLSHRLSGWLGQQLGTQKRAAADLRLLHQQSG